MIAELKKLQEVMEQPTMVINPESLSTLCLGAIVLNLEGTMATEVPETDGYLRLKAPFLPEQLCQDVVSAYMLEGLPLTDKFLHMLTERDKTRLVNIDLSGSQVSDYVLDRLCLQPLSSFKMMHCKNVSINGLKKLLDLQASNLEQLILGQYPLLLIKPSEVVGKSSELCDEGCMDSKNDQSGYINMESTVETELLDKLAMYKNLRAFSLHSLTKGVLAAPLSNFLASLKHLQHLDLSGCQCLIKGKQRLQYLTSLEKLTHLSSLILHGVVSDVNLPHYLPLLIKLKSLKHLDISSQYPAFQFGQEASPEDNHGEDLKCLVSELPHLCSLDVSGTCLVPRPDDGETYDPIPELQGRHFEFLGLFGCLGDPDERRSLPATKVAGQKNLAQLSVAINKYQHRGSYVHYTMFALSSMLKSGEYEDLFDLPESVCQVLNCHTTKPCILTCASSVMEKIMNNLCNSTKVHDYAFKRRMRRIARTLVSMMYINIAAVRRHALNALCLLQVPQDVWFMYQELVTTLLHVIQTSSDLFTRRQLLVVMRRLLQPINGKEKTTAGDCGLVEVILRMIETILNSENASYDVLELCWAVLLSATDEEPANSARFLRPQGEANHTGLTLFHDCYRKLFADWASYDSVDKENVIWYMTGVLANVSEVESLRSILAQPRLLHLLRELLSPTPSGIDVSHNTVSTICNILSHSEELLHYLPVSPNQMTAIDSSPNQMAANDSSSNQMAANDSSSNQMVANDSSSNQMAANDSSSNQMAANDSSSNQMAANDSSSNQITDEVDTLQKTSEGLLYNQETITREELLKALTITVNGWRLDTDRRLVYQSLHPVLKLLQCKHTVEIRLWACWELCNLTNVKASTYCPMLTEEGGVELLQDILSRPQEQTDNVMNLAQATLRNLANFNERRSADESQLAP